MHNKRYSKCRYACSLKHLKFLHNLCWQTVEQQSNPALAIASAVMRHAMAAELTKKDCKK